VSVPITTTRVGGQPVGESADAVTILGAVEAARHRHQDLHRADAAGTESRGQPVQRHPRRAVRGQGVRAGLAEHDAGERRGQQEQHAERGEQMTNGLAHHPGGPHLPAADPVPGLGPAQHGEPVDARADEHQHRGEQGQAGHHGQRDDHHGAHRHGPEAGNVDQEHPGQSDHHGQPGHGDAAPGSGHRFDDGRAGRPAVGQRLPESGHDEQGVVDADTDPDDRRGVGDVDRQRHEKGEQVQQAEGDAEADHRQQDGQAGGHGAAEDQQQHDQGDRKGDQLGLFQVAAGDLVLVRVERRPPADRHLHPGRSEIGQGCFDRGGVSELFALIAVHRDRQVGGGAVRGQLAGRPGVEVAAHRPHPGQPSDPLAGRSHGGRQLVGRRRVGGLNEHDDGVGRLPGETVLQQVLNLQ
jgi:hypothetical protein